MSRLENLGRCPRCHKFIIAEQLENHKCKPSKTPILGCEELIIDHITDSGKDEYGDQIHLAWGRNGTLYRLRVCKHHTSHNTNRFVTDHDTNREGDVTLRQVT